MNDKNLFHDINTYENIKRIIEENYITIYQNIYDQRIIEKSLKSLYKISYKREKQIISLSHVLDKNFNNKENNNKEIKIPILLLSIFLLDEYYEKIKFLTNTELILLSYALTKENKNYYDSIINTLSRNLLNHIYHKTTNYHKRIKLLEYILYGNDNRDKENELIEYVRNITEEDFNKDYEIYQKNLKISEENNKRYLNELY